MTTRVRLRSAFGVLFALAVGCSDNAGNGGPPGRGTAACNQWQAALCNWIAQCPTQGASCDQVKGIACKSDSEAQRCASALATPNCSAPPANCDLRDLADPAPAQKACNDFQAAVCQRSEECQAGSRDACLAQVQAKLKCADVIGVTLAYEQCMSEIPSLACNAPSSPASCNGVLLK